MILLYNDFPYFASYANGYLKKSVAFFLLPCYNVYMKNQSTGKTPIIFKIKLTTAMLFLSIAVLLLCGAGIGLSIWRIFKYGIHGFNDIIKYPFLIAVCVFCIVLMVSIFIKSQYAVDDKYLLTQYGFIKSRFTIADITALVYNTDEKKLTVKFGEEYTVVAVDPAWQEELVRALLAVKPEIDYSFTLAQIPDKK